MLILGDESYDRGKLPWITFSLIGLNFLLFCVQVRFGDPFTNGFALVPKEISEFRDIKGKQPITIKLTRHIGWDQDGDPIVVNAGQKTHYIHHYPGPTPIILTLLTYMFLHGDFLHLLFNMWFLFIFGRNVECALGNARFLAFYVACGIVAGVAQAFVEPSSIVPIVGASGAIAGVMGAYLAIFPFNKVKVFFGNWVMIASGNAVIELPAFGVIGGWFVLQYLAGVMTMHDDLVGGTAYFCHLGGFAAGFLSIKAIVLYLRYQIQQIEAELEPVESLPEDAPAPSLEPSLEEMDAIVDPVEAFKRARQGVFRNTPENDPFIATEPESRPAPATEDVAHAVTAGPPRPKAAADELKEAIRVR